MSFPREAIVLAGGFGTRLAHVVPDVCKPMAPVADRPFLRFILDKLAASGFERVVIADGYLKGQIEEFFGCAYRGLSLVYSSEEEPLFTGGAIKQAMQKCTSDWVFVLNGDTWADVDFDAIQNKADGAAKNIQCVISVKKMNNFDRYGTLDVRKDGFITAFNEKEPCTEGLINAGVYLLRRGSLASMPQRFSLENEYFEKVVEKEALLACEYEGDFIDIGLPEDYELAQTMLAPLAHSWKLAMFDRDGTINVDVGHLHEPEKLDLIPKTVELMVRYSSNPAYKVVVITNQAGISKGLYSTEKMRALHRHMDRELEKLGVHVDAWYFCPHHPEFTGECACRKPAPGMLLAAMHDFDTDACDCVMYGDKPSDEAAAKAAGVKFILAGEGCA